MSVTADSRSGAAECAPPPVPCATVLIVYFTEDCLTLYVVRTHVIYQVLVLTNY
jgi:hypothetical protein